MSKASTNTRRSFDWFWLPIWTFLGIGSIIFFWKLEHPGSATVVGALLGIWLAYQLNRKNAEKRRQDQYRSLLVSFAHELEEDYHRCVLYHEQRQKEEVSFSALFDFNDATTLSRLASVTDNPKIVDAITFLKKQYFQVGRHVENASSFITEYNKRLIEIKIKLPPDKIDLFDLDNRNSWYLLGLGNENFAEEAIKYKVAALNAQGTALAFFGKADDDNITYPKIVDCTLIIIQELKEKWSSDVTEELESRFIEDRKNLRDMENQKRQALTKTLTKQKKRPAKIG